MNILGKVLDLSVNRKATSQIYPNIEDFVQFNYFLAKIKDQSHLSH